jgi:hypothetical protein
MKKWEKMKIPTMNNVFNLAIKIIVIILTFSIPTFN